MALSCTSVVFIYNCNNGVLLNCQTKIIFLYFQTSCHREARTPNLKSTVPKCLRLFYSSVWKQPNKDGSVDEYGRSSYLTMQSILQWHLAGPPYKKIIDIWKNPQFQQVNQVLEGKLKMLKREGKDLLQHESPISEEDLKKMYSSGTFSVNNPNSLQAKVFFEVTLRFGQHGWESGREVTKQVIWNLEWCFWKGVSNSHT